MIDCHYWKSGKKELMGKKGRGCCTSGGSFDIIVSWCTIPGASKDKETLQTNLPAVNNQIPETFYFQYMMGTLLLF